jgi:phage antirepressor YoqD-like protein
MNSLVLGTPGATITSREIAELVDSRHPDVVRSIDRLVKAGVIIRPPTAFSDEINNLGLAVKREHYVFSGEQGKRDSIVVVAQLSPQFTARLVDRWQELETKVAKFDPAIVLSDPAAMRGLLLTYTERVLELQEVVAVQTPKVEALKRIEDAEGALGIREASQVLQVPERKLARFLDSEGWIFKMHGSSRWQGYSEKRKAGLLTHKVHRYRGEGGEWCESEAVRITPRGIAKLAEKLSAGIDLFAGVPA